MHGTTSLKSILICFFDSRGVAVKEFVPQGQTVNEQYYREVLERLRKRIHRVRPEIADTWILHHDNAPCHTANSVNEFLAKKGISVVPQPPYSPDSSPCDFFLFPKLKFHLKGRHFGIVDSRDRPAEGTSTWRLPALLPGVGATSPAMFGFPRELLWGG